MIQREKERIALRSLALQSGYNENVDQLLLKWWLPQ